jgi:hypothetical protein
MFMNTIQAIGLYKCKYNLHSLQAGGASSAANFGISDRILKKLLKILALNCLLLRILVFEVGCRTMYVSFYLCTAICLLYLRSVALAHASRSYILCFEF